jgi:hypothetical protein
LLLFRQEGEPIMLPDAQAVIDLLPELVLVVAADGAYSAD